MLPLTPVKKWLKPKIKPTLTELATHCLILAKIYIMYKDELFQEKMSLLFVDVGSTQYEMKESRIIVIYLYKI